ncbi:MAG: RNA polymerase sigma factor, partial [Anaerolineales bacterium]
MNETITFESMIEAHGAEVFRYIWRLVADDNEAQDCLQETYVRAWRAFDRLG